MLGESLREMGILMIVFYGLSSLVKVAGLTWQELLGAVVGLLTGCSLWAIGANLEIKE